MKTYHPSVQHSMRHTALCGYAHTSEYGVADEEMAGLVCRLSAHQARYEDRQVVLPTALDADAQSAAAAALVKLHHTGLPAAETEVRPAHTGLALLYRSAEGRSDGRQSARAVVLCDHI